MSDWLFDGDGAPSPEEARLMALLLDPYRREPPALPLPEPANRPMVSGRTRPWLRGALIGLAAAAALLIGLLPGPGGGSTVNWPVETLSGPSPCGSADCRLGLGDWLHTGPGTTASLAVADIGTISLDPGTRLQLRGSRPEEHRLRLAEGRIEASIHAPPRVLVVETPSAQAIDLGCGYSLSVDAAGNGSLVMRSGHVELRSISKEAGGRVVVVPAGATARLREGSGPGTPIWWDADPALEQALLARDEGGPLSAVLSAPLRSKDTLSLVHLLREPEGARALDAILSLVPAAAEVDRARVLAGDPAATAALWRRLIPFWQ